jgi:hypothetical protein
MAPPPDPGRRLGERIPIGDVFVTWRLERIQQTKRRKSAEPEMGRLLDVSVSGGAIVAPVSEDLKRGSIVVIQLGNAQAVVRVRRIEDFGDAAWRTYGVEFVETDPAFLDWINMLLERRRPSTLVETWNSAF